MSALRRRTGLGIAALAFAACTQPQPEPKSPDDAATPGVGGPQVLAPPPSGPAVAKWRVQFSMRELGTMLDAGTKSLGLWIPDEGVDLKSQFGAALSSEGFAPGTVDLLNLDATHAGRLAIPHTGQEHAIAQDVELVAFLATQNAKGLIESLPTGVAPQPLGGGLWQGLVDDTAFSMREQADALEVALAVEALDQARGLAQAAPTQGPRIHFKAWDLPTEGIAEGFPFVANTPLEPIVRVLADVAEDMGAVNLTFDLAEDIGAEFTADIEAPFDRLGLEPLGAPMTGPSSLASQLPEHPIFAVDAAWGDPAKLHRLLDDVTRKPLNQLPSPFAEHVVAALEGLHKAMDQVEESVLAGYLDKRGRATIVLAATVHDEVGAREAERMVLGSVHALLSEHIKLQGNDPELKYTAAFKLDSVRVGAVKADHLRVTLPRALKQDDDMKALAAVIGPAKKAQLDIYAVAKGKTIIVAVGAGAKPMLATLGKGLGAPLAKSIEDQGGLEVARRASGGCQVCIVLEPKQIGRVLLTVAKDAGEKGAKKALSRLDKLTVDGQVSMGGSAKKTEAHLAAVLPASLVFPTAGAAAGVRKIFDDLDQESSKAAPVATVER